MRSPELLPDRAAYDRCLLPGRVLRLGCARPGRLTAREGMLWITHEAVAAPRHWTSEDRFLSPGEAIDLVPGDVVVVSACNPRYGMAALDWEPRARVAARPASQPRWGGVLQGLARLAGAEAALLA